MHILLIHQAFAALDEPGGTRHHEMARFLARQGHRVTIIASPVSYLTGKAGKTRFPFVERQNDGENITVLRTYTYSALHRSFVHRVFSFLSFMISSFLAGLRVEQVDVVWGTSPPIFQGATAWALARLKGARLLFEVRDLWPAFAVAVGVLTHPLLIVASEWLERFLYRHADLVMVNSPGFVQHIRQRGARRIELVPNGADPHMFSPQDDGANFRQQHNLKGKFVVLYAGAHGMSNDLDMVLEAARLLQSQPEIHFVLLGAGKEKSRLQQRAEEMVLPNLTFLPPVPKHQMATALAAADACLAILKPIKMYKTVYPNKVFDYMAAGRAVILAIDGVIREVVEDAGCGVFVPPGNPSALAKAIGRMAGQPEQCRQMGMRGRSAIEQRFDRSALSAQLANLLAGLLKQ